MNSRRLTFVLVRTGVFLVVGLVLFTVIGWSPFAATAVVLIAAAMAVQLGGVVWLRRTERAPAERVESHRTGSND
ncbi:cytochrome c biogenesis factor [Actinopolyspora lacussalsi]|nr:cytochrome c biogenesis factor [Actinopolyspora lacussalsi]